MPPEFVTWMKLLFYRPESTEDFSRTWEAPGWDITSGERGTDTMRSLHECSWDVCATSVHFQEVSF